MTCLSRVASILVLCAVSAVPEVGNNCFSICCQTGLLIPGRLSSSYIVPGFCFAFQHTLQSVVTGVLQEEVKVRNFWAPYYSNASNFVELLSFDDSLNLNGLRWIYFSKTSSCFVEMLLSIHVSITYSGSDYRHNAWLFSA